MKGFILTAMVVGVSASALARPELNAFINKPANTIPELIAQIKSDSVVLDRYMRHFSMSKTEVIDYVGTLRLGTIKKGGNYVVYSIPEGGMVKAHVSNFKTGTPAFVDKAGNPILRVKCGNPFVRGPVKAYAFSGAAPAIEEANEMKVSAIPDTITSLPTPSGSTLVAQVPEITPMEEAVTDSAPQALRTVPPAPAPTVRGQPISVGSNNALGAIGAIGALGAVAAISSNTDQPAPVPEPASMIALATGAVAIATRRKKK